MKAILLLTIVLTFASCKPGGGETISLGARSPANDIDYLPIRWADSRLPLNVHISTDFVFNPADDDAQNRNQIEQMQKVWDDAVTGKVLFNYPIANIAGKGAAVLSEYKDSTIGIYLSNDWFTDVTSSALAVTQFFAYKRTSSSGEYYELNHADIIVNNKNYSFSYDPTSFVTYDMSTVVLHELGHLLGMKHQKNRSIPAVMQPYLSIYESKRILSANDSQRISDSYTDTALTGGSGLVLGASYAPSGIPDGEELHGVIELLASGECRHFHNGELIKSHFSF